MARDEPVVVVGQPIASQADVALFTACSKSRSTMCTACRTSQPRRFTLHVPLNISETVEAKTIAAPATRAQCGPKSIELSRLPVGAVAGRPAGAEDLFLPWNGTTILAGGSRRFRIPIGIENSGSAGSAASLLSPRRVTLLPRVLRPGMRGFRD